MYNQLEMMQKALVLIVQCYQYRMFTAQFSDVFLIEDGKMKDVNRLEEASKHLVAALFFFSAFSQQGQVVLMFL